MLDGQFASRLRHLKIKYFAKVSVCFLFMSTTVSCQKRWKQMFKRLNRKRAICPSDDFILYILKILRRKKDNQKRVMEIY